jgi:hypothetical protein
MGEKISLEMNERIQRLGLVVTQAGQEERSRWGCLPRQQTSMNECDDADVRTVARFPTDMSARIRIYTAGWPCSSSLRGVHARSSCTLTCI